MYDVSCAPVLLVSHVWCWLPSILRVMSRQFVCVDMQVKELNLEEGGAFTVSSADEILSAL